LGHRPLSIKSSLKELAMSLDAYGALGHPSRQCQQTVQRVFVLPQVDDDVLEILHSRKVLESLLVDGRFMNLQVSQVLKAHEVRNTLVGQLNVFFESQVLQPRESCKMGEAIICDCRVLEIKVFKGRHTRDMLQPNVIQIGQAEAGRLESWKQGQLPEFVHA